MASTAFLDEIYQRIENLLPLRQVTFQCRFTKPTQFQFYHQTVVPAYLYTQLNRLPPEQAKSRFRLLLPETGRTNYYPDETYRFAILFLAGNVAEAGALVEKMAAQPESSTPTADNKRLVQHWQLESLADGFSEQVFEQIALRPAPLAVENFLAQLAEFDRNCFNAQVGQLNNLASDTPLVLRFDTGFICNDWQRCDEIHCGFTLSTLLKQLLSAIVYASPSLQAEQTQRLQALLKSCPDAVYSGVSIHQQQFSFVCKTYANSKSKHKHLSGFHGELALSIDKTAPYRELWLQLLIMGQYLGLGKRTNYAMGQYRLLIDGQSQKAAPVATRPLLTHYLDQRHLKSQRHLVQTGQKNHQAALEAAKTWLKTGSPPALSLEHRALRPHYFIDLDAPHGQSESSLLTLQQSARPVRLLEQSIVRQLQKLWASQTKKRKKYQKNGSTMKRFTAARNHADGPADYAVVLNMQPVYQGVSHRHLETQLAAIIADDVAAKMILQRSATEQQLQQRQGLMRGSVFWSFWQQLIFIDWMVYCQQQNLDFVDSADQWVIFASTESQAKSLRTQLTAYLQHDVIAFSEGDIAILKSPDFSDYQAAHSPPPDEFVDDMDTIDDIDDTLVVPEYNQVRGADQAINQGSGDISIHGQTLLLIPSVGRYDYSNLSVQQNQLIVLRDAPNAETKPTKNKSNSLTNDEHEWVEVCSIPLAHLSQIILVGTHHLTTPLVKQCLYRDIALHYMATDSRYLGSLSAAQSRCNLTKVRLWMLQETYLTEDEYSLNAARLVISARIHNIQRTLQRYKCAPSDKIRVQQQKALNAKNIESLRGIEGQVTAEYYRAIDTLLSDTEFSFTKRTRRPPADPFNVLLSYGYSILYRYLQGFVLIQNLNPDRGFYHYSQVNQQALCSDLIEPFRHVVERAALTVIRRKQLNHKHFTKQGRACYLTTEGRKIYLTQLIQTFANSTQHGALGKNRNIKRLYDQVLSFKHWLLNPDGHEFVPFYER